MLQNYVSKPCSLKLEASLLCINTGLLALEPPHMYHHNSTSNSTPQGNNSTSNSTPREIVSTPISPPEQQFHYQFQLRETISLQISPPEKQVHYKFDHARINFTDDFTPRETISSPISLPEKQFQHQPISHSSYRHWGCDPCRLQSTLSQPPLTPRNLPRLLQAYSLTALQTTTVLKNGAPWPLAQRKLHPKSHPFFWWIVASTF